MTAPIVAVIGASGQVGRFALPMLVREDRPVLAISRQGHPPDYPELPGVRWTAPDDDEVARNPGIGALLSAGPIGLAHDALKRHRGIRRAVVVSSSSVFSKRDSPHAGERKMMATLAQTEQRILDHCREHGVHCVLLRPTLIYGAGMDDNLSRLVRWIERHGWLPLARDAQGLRQPLHAEDLATACVKALHLPLDQPMDGPLCGGSTLSFRAMVERLFEAAGREPNIVSLPGWLLAAAVALAARTPWLRGANPQMVSRQGMDLVFDDTALRHVLGVSPRPFAPGPQDFQRPTAAKIHALAKRDPA